MRRRIVSRSDNRSSGTSVAAGAVAVRVAPGCSGVAEGGVSGCVGAAGASVGASRVGDTVGDRPHPTRIIVGATTSVMALLIEGASTPIVDLASADARPGLDITRAEAGALYHRRGIHRRGRGGIIEISACSAISAVDGLSASRAVCLCWALRGGLAGKITRHTHWRCAPAHIVPTQHLRFWAGVSFGSASASVRRTAHLHLRRTAHLHLRRPAGAVQVGTAPTETRPYEALRRIRARRSAGSARKRGG